MSTKKPGSIGRFAAVVGLVVVFGVVAATGWWLYWVRVQNRFATITEGEVYQSSAMTADEMAELVNEFGIRTVIDMRREDEGGENMVAERRVLADLGVIFFHLPSLQVPNDETVDRFLQYVADEEHRPFLIHCKHGEGRSVLFAALYRIEFEGWSNQRARQATRLILWRTGFSLDRPKGRYLDQYQPRLREQN